MKECFKKVARHTSSFFSRVFVWFAVVLISYCIVISNHYLRFFDIEPKTWQEIYHVSSPILVGGLTSFLFYFLVVHLPTRHKNRIVKANLKQKYVDVKKEILYQVIFASREGGRTDLVASPQTVEQLSTVEGFRSAFQEGKSSTEGFYAFCNYINTDEASHLFKEIILNLRILSKQIEFVLHNYPITDKRVYDVFKHLESVLMHIDTLRPGEYYDAEHLSKFIYSVFAGSSFVDGRRDYDIIEKTIEDI